VRPRCTRCWSIFELALEDAGLAQQGALRATDRLRESMRRRFQLFFFGDAGDHLGAFLHPGPDRIEPLGGTVDPVLRAGEHGAVEVFLQLAQPRQQVTEFVHGYTADGLARGELRGEVTQAIVIVVLEFEHHRERG
jgi:hypothetical protein